MVSLQERLDEVNKILERKEDELMNNPKEGTKTCIVSLNHLKDSLEYQIKESL